MMSTVLKATFFELASSSDGRTKIWYFRWQDVVHGFRACVQHAGAGARGAGRLDARARAARQAPVARRARAPPLAHRLQRRRPAALHRYRSRETDAGRPLVISTRTDSDACHRLSPETTGTNPQFHVGVGRGGAAGGKCHVVVSVTQQYEPRARARLHAIGFAVYELPPAAAPRRPLQHLHTLVCADACYPPIAVEYAFRTSYILKLRKRYEQKGTPLIEFIY